MRHSSRELTHPSWHREPEPADAPRESLMGQMVRAQLFFDRRTPPNGLPAWRDADGEAVPVRVSARVGTGTAEFLDDAPPVPADAVMSSPTFAQELNERLRLAHERVAAEQVHLAQVDSVADAYLGRPSLRLVK